jgi:hypothetical protein
MLIHGRQWVDIFSYHPRLAIPPIRVVRDEKFIGVLKPMLEAFVALLLRTRIELEQRFGPFTRPAPEIEQPSEILDGVTEQDVEQILEAQREGRIVR